MPSSFTGFSSDFIDRYYAKGDPFQSLLARSTYLTKYSRDDETWSDTIARVVDGNIRLDPDATQEEAERLYEIFWNMKALPSGRGLWTGGITGMVLTPGIIAGTSRYDRPRIGVGSLTR